MSEFHQGLSKGNIYQFLPLNVCFYGCGGLLLKNCFKYLFMIKYPLGWEWKLTGLHKIIFSSLFVSLQAAKGQAGNYPMWGIIYICQKFPFVEAIAVADWPGRDQLCTIVTWSILIIKYVELWKGNVIACISWYAFKTLWKVFQLLDSVLSSLEQTWNLCCNIVLLKLEYVIGLKCWKNSPFLSLSLQHSQYSQWWSTW